MKIRCLYDRLVPIEELKKKFHPKNNNLHSEEQIVRLAAIMKYQGVRHPIKLSKRSDFITAGHGRVLAGELNGWTELPVNDQDYDDEVQEYADVQADNAIAAWAELNLQQINLDLAEMGPFELDMLGIKDFVLEPLEKIDYGNDDVSSESEVHKEGQITKIILNYTISDYEKLVSKIKEVLIAREFTTLVEMFTALVEEECERVGN